MSHCQRTFAIAPREGQIIGVVIECEGVIRVHLQTGIVAGERLIRFAIRIEQIPLCQVERGALRAVRLRYAQQTFIQYLYTGLVVLAHRLLYHGLKQIGRCQGGIGFDDCMQQAVRCIVVLPVEFVLNQVQAYVGAIRKATRHSG